MAVPIHNHKLLIPIEILRFVSANKLYKPFQIFIYLKCHSSGKVKDLSTVLADLQTSKVFRDPRTISKHLQVILDLRWVGYNSKTGVYFIRGFDNIRKSHGFRNRKSVEFETTYFKNFRAFITGALICAKITALKFVFEVAKPRKLNAAPKNKDGANQYYKYQGKAPDYYGIGNKGIASILGTSQTTACEQKNAAEKSGFIFTRPKWKQFMVLSSPDWALRPHVELSNPSLRGRLRFKRIGGQIFVFQQMHDEIIPRLRMKKRPKFCKGISFSPKNSKNQIVGSFSKKTKKD